MSEPAFRDALLDAYVDSIQYRFLALHGWLLFLLVAIVRGFFWGAFVLMLVMFLASIALRHLYIHFWNRGLK